MFRQSEIGGSLRRQQHLVDRPSLAFGGVAPHLRRREAIEGVIIGRMHCYQLPLQMGRELGDLDPILP
jgi:hypothetical protein